MPVVIINTAFWLGQGPLAKPITITPGWSAVLLDGVTFYPATPITVQPYANGTISVVLEPGYYTLTFDGGQTVVILVPTTGTNLQASTLVTSAVAQPIGSVNNQYINGDDGHVYYLTVNHPNGASGTAAGAELTINFGF